MGAHLVFALWVALFFWALFMCSLAHNPDAALTIGVLPPVPYRLISGVVGGCGAVALLFLVIYGGWRALLAAGLVLVVVGINALALSVTFRTWDVLSAVIPIAWGIGASVVGIVLVLVDYAALWAVKRLSGVGRPL